MGVWEEMVMEGVQVGWVVWVVRVVLGATEVVQDTTA
jgi:hypothetical protein